VVRKKSNANRNEFHKKKLMLCPAMPEIKTCSMGHHSGKLHRVPLCPRLVSREKSRGGTATRRRCSRCHCCTSPVWRACIDPIQVRTRALRRRCSSKSCRYTDRIRHSSVMDEGWRNPPQFLYRQLFLFVDYQSSATCRTCENQRSQERMMVRANPTPVEERSRKKTSLRSISVRSVCCTRSTHSRRPPFRLPCSQKAT